jgi:N-methylhydantoinase A
MFGGRAADVDPGEVEEAFARLEAEARERLEAEGIPEDRMTLRRTIDMRYVGQWRSLAVEVDGPVESLDDAIEAFHSEHEREHAYRRDDTPVEIYQLNLQAVGETRKAELPSHDRDGGGQPETDVTRDVRFAGEGEPVQTPVFRRDALPAGTRFTGPALVDQLDSTVLVPPGVECEVDEWLNIRMAIPQEAADGE